MVRRTKFRNFSGGLHLKKVSWGKGFLRLMMLAALIATLGLVTAPVAPVSAVGGWYDSAWLYRQEITIDHNRVGTMSALTSNADSGTDFVIVQDTSRFSPGDFVVIMDDSNSNNETCEIYDISVGQNKLTMWDPLSNNYTTTDHAFVKNDSTQGTDLINFPVLVKISDQDNPIFIHAQTGEKAGEDILFTDVDGTKLSHEIDYYSDSGTKELDAWVKVPTVSTSADTTLYMYYGNGSCSSQEDAENVWLEDYVMVQHLQETSVNGTYVLNSTYNDHLDSTSNHNDGEVFTNSSVCSENITIPNNPLPQTVTLTHHPLNEYPPVVVCQIVGVNYIYYDEGTDWELNYGTGVLTALKGGGMQKGKAYWFDYTYSDGNPGANMDVPGQIAGADSFDGLDDFIDCKDVNIGNITEAITVEAWVNLGWRAGIGMEVDNPDYGIAAGTPWEMCIWTEDVGTPIEEEPDPLRYYNDGWFQISGGQYDVYDYNIIIHKGEWAYVVITFDGEDIYSYVNRDFDATKAAPGSLDGVPGDPVFIGMSTDLCEAVKGSIDEVRISNVARGAEWISTSYSNQVSPTVFYSLGEEEEEGADTTPPANVTDLAVSSPTVSSLTLNWTAPGDDGSVGTALEYDIRYASEAITELNWAAATTVADEPSPSVAGSSESFEVTGLSSNTTYYFALKTVDEVPNWSGLSNSPDGTTLPLPTVAFSAATYSVGEGGGSATITVNLSAASAEIVTVDYTSSDGTATAGSDYTAASGTLTFNSSETSKTFSVTIVDDEDVESDETVDLALSSPSNATLGEPNTAVLTIVDNDGVTPTLMEGDVNLSDNVDIVDAMFTLQYAVGLITFDADQLECADTYDDGSVDITDAMHILQWVVDPTGDLGVLKVPLWESPGDDDMLHPVP